MGTLWDWVYPRNWIEPEFLPPTPFGLKRITAVALSVCQQAFSSSSLYILVAILGVGLLSAFLPAGCLQKAAGKDDMLAPLTMAGVATLAYITPMVAIVQIASMFQHGNSIGAAFTLLVLGTGVNLGLILWTFRTYGSRPAMIWNSGLILIVLGLGYCVDRPLRPKGVEPADHTHAFDIYCNPHSFPSSDVASTSIRLIQESWKAEEIFAGFTALLLIAIGFASYRFDPKGRWMEWLIHQNKDDLTKTAAVDLSKGLKRDILLPNSVIAACSIAGLVIASVAGCFLYYPPVSEIRKELQANHAELIVACAQHEWDQISYWIPIQEDWVHKLSVSCYLRNQPVSKFQKMKLRTFMVKLELLEHAAEDKDKGEVDQYKQELSLSFLRLKAALNSSR